MDNVSGSLTLTGFACEGLIMRWRQEGPWHPSRPTTCGVNTQSVTVCAGSLSPAASGGLRTADVEGLSAGIGAGKI